MALIAAGATAGAAGGALLLAAAGLGHLRGQRAFRAVLRVQQVLPGWSHRPAAALATAAELLVGLAVPAALLAAPWLVVAPLVAQTAVYGGFAGYLGWLRRRRPSVPCGCFGTDQPVTWLLVARAALLAAAAAGAAALAPEVAAMPAAVRQLGLAGGAVVAMAGWLLGTLAGRTPPTASRRPGRSGSPPAWSGRRS